jgi:hypothetical protein
MGGMRWRLLVVPLLVAAGCTGASASEEGQSSPVRLLVAGTVDLTGPAAAVADADPEGLLREVRRMVRLADLAVVVSLQGQAEPVLAAAGFDAVACPQPKTLAIPATGHSGAEEVRLRCGTSPGAGPSPGGLTLMVRSDTPVLTASGADVAVSAAGATLSIEMTIPPVGPAHLAVSGLGTLLSGDPSAGGAVLEVLADEAGVVAFRVGRITHADLRTHFAGWDLPEGDASLLDGEWWTLTRLVTPVPVSRPPADLPFERGDLTAAAVGDVTGDGVPDVAAAYRHPHQPGLLSEALPGAVGVDSRGRSAHLGIFTPEGEALWAAGVIPRPVGDLAACDGSVALAYTGLDDPGIAATGAAVWRGLSLRPAPELPGIGVPGCADVDGDGHLDPVILGRST